MIKLNLEEVVDSAPSKPWLPYKYYPRGLCHNRYLSIKHTVRITKGSDPYGGDEWQIDLLPASHPRRRPWLRLVLCDLINWSVALRCGPLHWTRSAYEFKQMPWWFRWLWDRLEYRREWFEANEYEPDPMGSLSQYE